jgi:hypothetical protein
MLFAKTNINTENKVVDLYQAKGIRKDAPTWVKDCFTELISLGNSTQDALAKLRRSPFFHDDFVQV